MRLYAEIYIDQSYSLLFHRLTPKRPDRELYVPGCRKQTVQSCKSEQTKRKDDNMSSRLDESHDLLQGSRGDEEKRSHHMMNVDSDSDHMLSAVCNNEYASDVIIYMLTKHSNLQHLCFFKYFLCCFL